MPSKHLFFVFLLGILILNGCGHAEKLEPFQIIDAVDSVVNRALEEFNVPGIAVGLTIDNKVILAKGYGFRDLNQRTPVTKNTLFGIGSCTKAFTSFLLGQLVDEGKITWDDPVIKYLPEFRLSDPYTTYTLTLRDLLAHRTGMARHDFLWANPAISNNEMIRKLQYLDSAYKLRDKFQYSNIMYAIAGLVIERVTGQSWNQALSSRIFSPLGMMNSLSIPVMESPIEKRKDYSLPYSETTGKIQSVPFRSMLFSAPSGAISSNVMDMLPWIQLHLSNGIFNNQEFINEDTLQEMHAIQMPLNASVPTKEIYYYGYGLGWFTGIYRGNPILSHDGCIDGFISQVALLPRNNIGIVVLSNNSSGGSFAVNCIINTIFDKLLGATDFDWVEKGKFEREQIISDMKKQQEQVNEGMVQPLPPRQLQEYIGHYEHPAYGLVQIQQKDDGLVASYGEMTFHLNHKCYDAFNGQLDQNFTFASSDPIYFSFLSNLSGTVYELQIPFEPAVQPISFKRRHEPKN